MKKVLFSIVFCLFICVVSTNIVYAGPGPCDGPEDVGNCVNGRECRPTGFPSDPYGANGPPCGAGVGNAVIGDVIPPVSVMSLNNPPGSTSPQIGILRFANRIVLLVTIIAGILVMFNFIKAGWLYLAGGSDTKATGEVKDLLTYSVIGLVIIAVTYTIAGLIGFIFFGDAGFILNPELYSALDIW